MIYPITIGIHEICPTDATLFITGGGVYKVLLIETPAWKKAGEIKGTGLQSVTLLPSNPYYEAAREMLK